MKYKTLNELKEEIEMIVSDHLLKNTENKRKIEELSDYIDFKKEKFEMSDFDNIIIFLETVFVLEHYSEGDFLALFKQLKRIEMNVFLIKLINVYENFIPEEIFIEGSVENLKQGSVIYINDEIHFIKNEMVRTTKGYQVTTCLLLEGEFQYFNNIYIEPKDGSFVLLGTME